jgi:hypothetical protein
MAGCPSGQWKRTVNPSAYAYAGSNPAPATQREGPLTWAFARRGPFVVVRLHPARSGGLRLSVRKLCGSLGVRAGREGSLGEPTRTDREAGRFYAGASSVASTHSSTSAHSPARSCAA